MLRQETGTLTIRAAFLIVMATGLVAAGCGSDDDGGGGGSSTTNSGQLNLGPLPPGVTQAKRDEAVQAGEKDAAAAGDKVEPPKGRTIGFMYLTEQTEPSRRVLDGVQKAADLFGFEVETCDPNLDPKKFAQCATTLTAKKPDIIISNASDPALLGAGLKQAAREDIPWIVTASLQTESPDFTAQYVPDEEQLTQLLDEWFFAQMEAKGANPATFAAFQAPIIGPGSRNRDVQRKRDIEQSGGKVREVVTHDIDLSDPVQDTIKTTRQALTQHPELAGLWNTCDFCVPPMAQAADQAGRTGDNRPVITGIYSTKETRQAIIDGRVNGVVEINFEVMGWVAMDQALEHWARAKEFFPDSGVFTEGYSIKFLQPWIMDKSNVGDDPDIIVNKGPDFEAYFKTKWNKEFGVG